jgi:hypothetical protein
MINYKVTSNSKTNKNKYPSFKVRMAVWIASSSSISSVYLQLNILSLTLHKLHKYIGMILKSEHNLARVLFHSDQK